MIAGLGLSVALLVVKLILQNQGKRILLQTLPECCKHQVGAGWMDLMDSSPLGGDKC